MSGVVSHIFIFADMFSSSQRSLFPFVSDHFSSSLGRSHWLLTFRVNEITGYISFWPAFLYLAYILKVYPYHSMGQYCIPFHDWIISHCMYTPHFFIHQSIDIGLGCFYCGTMMHNAGMSMCVEAFLWTCAFSSLGYMPRGGIAGLSYGLTPCLTFWRTDKLSQSGWFILHPHKQFLMFLVSPHSYQHLLLSIFFIIIILLNIEWYLIVVFVFP